MKIRFFNETDEWTTDGSRITDPQHLDTIRKTLEDVGPVIVEHWFYRGATAPERFVFDEFEDFTTYLDMRACAGDAIDVWSFSALCKMDNRLAGGKCPDDAGRVPKRGAY